VDTNAEIDVPVCRQTGVRFGESSLRIHRTLHGVYGAPEFGKNTVASRVRYAAPVFANEPVEDCAPFGQPLERADLISAHEAAVAFNICCEDRNEASADFRRVGHACPNGTSGEVSAGGLPPSSEGRHRRQLLDETPSADASIAFASANISSSECSVPAGSASSGDVRNSGMIHPLENARFIEAPVTK
jgi:hypothetical protein